MPDWAVEILKGLLGAVFGVGAGSYGVFKYLEHRQLLKQEAQDKREERESHSEAEERDRQRAARADEISTLYDIINRLKEGEAELRSEFNQYRADKDKALSELRSEHTACRLALTQVKMDRKFLREQLAAQNEILASQEDRLKKMEGELAELRGAS